MSYHTTKHVSKTNLKIKNHTNGIHKTQTQVLSTPPNMLNHLSYHYSLLWLAHLIPLKCTPNPQLLIIRYLFIFNFHGSYTIVFGQRRSSLPLLLVKITTSWWFFFLHFLFLNSSFGFGSRDRDIKIWLCVGWRCNGGGSSWQPSSVFTATTMDFVLGYIYSFLVAYVSQQCTCCIVLVF